MKIVRLTATEQAISIELVAHNEQKFGVNRLLQYSIEESWASHLTGDELQIRSEFIAKAIKLLYEALVLSVPS